jgi:hypothetical protein
MTYLQDVAIGTNGDIYMTTVSPGAFIYSIAGATSEAPTFTTVHKFEDLNAATGIREPQPGIYNFLAGKQGNIGVGKHGTYSVFELDVRNGTQKITELVPIRDGGLIVGVIPVPGFNNTVLVSDSTDGKIYRVNTATRQYETVLKDPTMLPPPWGLLPFGVGGIQLHKGYLYFVNTFRAIIHRIKFNDDGYPAPGAKVEQALALRTIYIDNFVIGQDDTIWAALNADNRVVAVTSLGKGTVTVVAGAPDELTIPGPVAAGFGRLPGDTENLYVVTGGGLLNPINGSYFEPGKISVLDTSPF